MDREIDEQTCLKLYDNICLFADSTSEDGLFKWDNGLGIDGFTIKRNDLPPGTESKLSLKRLIGDDGDGRYVQIFITLGSVDHSSCELLYDTVANVIHTSVKSNMSYSQHKDLIRVSFELFMCLFVLYRSKSPLKIQSEMKLLNILSYNKSHYRMYDYYIEKRKTIET